VISQGKIGENVENSRDVFHQWNGCLQMLEPDGECLKYVCCNFGGAVTHFV